ncbi:WhiB family transcriptional regulator [Streptomyces vietnamensis]|uniref:WhiB family transcriptional regulator n=1 Tax=Streptomyces vietnamensis TaxID=362257 RepID=UPI00379DE4DE
MTPTAEPQKLSAQDSPQQSHAKTVYTSCPVHTECLAEDLDHRIAFGVWGRMAEGEHRALPLRRLDVVSGRQILDDARHAQGQPRAWGPLLS